MGSSCCCPLIPDARLINLPPLLLLLLQDNERKQRAQPKETPEEVAEAEAVFADF